MRTRQVKILVLCLCFIILVLINVKLGWTKWGNDQESAINGERDAPANHQDITETLTIQSKEDIQEHDGMKTENAELENVESVPETETQPQIPIQSEVRNEKSINEFSSRSRVSSSYTSSVSSHSKPVVNKHPKQVKSKPDSRKSKGNPRKSGVEFSQREHNPGKPQSGSSKSKHNLGKPLSASRNGKLSQLGPSKNNRNLSRSQGKLSVAGTPRNLGQNKKPLHTRNEDNEAQDETRSVDIKQEHPEDFNHDVVSPLKHQIALSLQRQPGSNPDVVFPSTTNCSRKEYAERIRNHKGPPNPTLNVYPCRLWKNVKKNAPWPTVFPPTNGSVIRSLEVHHEDPQIQAMMEEQMMVQEERVSRLTSTCLSHPEASIAQSVHLVWDTARNPPLVYCPLYKVASTTWSVYFLRLAHVNEDNPALKEYSQKAKERKKYMPKYGGGHRRVNKEYKPPESGVDKRRVFSQALRFIVVRHPFTRLLSAYRDKLETRKPKPYQPYFLDLQRAIIQRYRRTSTPETSIDSFINSTTDSHPSANPDIHLLSPTFSEFVDYIIDSTANFTTMKEWSEVVCWTPYWVQCGVCASDFQMVIKLESMTEEEQFLAHLADLKEIQNLHEWRNSKKKKATSAAVVPEYYRSLTETQVKLLYERYQLDFDLFGYTIDDYLQYAIKE